MKTFYCDSCGSLVFFENVKCLGCDHDLGFIPGILDMSAIEPDGNAAWRALAGGQSGKYRPCENGWSHHVCNWLVPADTKDSFCVACNLNRTIPDLSVAENRERWFKMESAKRRLIYTLLSLKLPMTGWKGRPALRFAFVADPPGGPAFLTGHENGLITMNVAEADDVERERRRVGFREPYRTLLGHFRHEVGHYYWDQLIADSPRLGKFRELFGDETWDYSAALELYHNQGAPADWQKHLISAYASAHPWEDWAESWAHYLHMIDSIETAAGFGLTLRPKHPSAPTMRAEPEKAVNGNPEFTKFLANWLPVTNALNALNRGMGLPDLYPFVLSDPVVAKLRFIHETIGEASRQ